MESPYPEGVTPKGRSGTLAWLPAILDHADLDPTETLLMLALADHVDAADRCFVGIERLAARARVSYGTARRRLAELEARGYLTRERRRRDDGNLSVYDYVLARGPFGLAEPARNLRDDQRAPRRAVTSAHPGARAEPPRVEPPREEQLRMADPPEYAPSVAAHTFDLFWQQYPRREAKGAARKAWPAAIRKAEPDQIIEGARRYAADPNRDPAYTAHASTWLNAERWDDGPLPPRRRNGRPTQHAPDDTDDARRDLPAGRLHL